ncbi:MAG: hypothetical protein A3C93_01670 [Candidatus Lloydbacteria bacterium RIFCSPHIGHO2_02_FULL_54_17]|uniref:ParB-like N-terminal domain-containing protein n=1 Tax=Candidatus Lloydbacteria bacterium RIFCSPHIGHO2_02_FULL_54_17 TaxID=1798664 RepID=A0A1G2DDP6_9BACT|nr:MAG: hypothetical protein A2762_02850 [Candidatus Lloydbacteria bacterium RIFCSPHIGHO2_01_FULL_54_11]OGZ11061.1 MAG: hypothetical protein A3C93_01670 [Candidatus Lloydbacteria bacterium RIFCSPHIGHO2_02_FULL_54_17]OGZ14460.1 MAG: hypothetical protein A3H76_06185 [Candidatus Lloydbacteria bacterium RIFCSPLOWO2_02_FULL_54_12]OGZ15476.1 MAG: hypothetical protein A2948_02790 [Candidatus Lloydbacteria bacterium RIFCSPLOWO2_01_FULL_54_18]
MQELWLPISELRFTAKKRRGVSPKRVEELRREIEDGNDLRPIRVHALGDGTYIVKDGRHRIQAHLAAGLVSIAAMVENLGERTRRWFTLFTHRFGGVFLAERKGVVLSFF